MVISTISRATEPLDLSTHEGYIFWNASKSSSTYLYFPEFTEIVYRFAPSVYCELNQNDFSGTESAIFAESSSLNSGASVIVPTELLSLLVREESTDVSPVFLTA